MASMTGMAIDPLAVLIAVGVLGVLGLYFRHVLKQICQTFLVFREIADTRATRQRAEIDANGTQSESVMRRTGQILSITLLVILVSYLVFRKFGVI